MITPPLNEAQRDALATHVRRLERRTDLAPESREFLVEIRKLMLLADVSQERLAGRIKENAARSGQARLQTALPGHTRGGTYSSSNMSDELLARTGHLPRPSTVLAVAELYFEEIGQPSLENVHDDLEKLKDRASVAQTQLDDDREDADIDEKDRAPGGLAYRRLRLARDRARAEADSLRERLDELEAASSVDQGEIERLADEGQALQRKLDVLKDQLLQRDDELTASELLVDEQSRQLTGGQARIDQLEAEVADLNAEVVELRDRLGRSWLQRFRQQRSESGETLSEPREHGKHRLEPDDDEPGEPVSVAEDGSGDAQGASAATGLGGGEGGVGLQQLTEPARARARARRPLLLWVAVSVLVIAGLVTFAAAAAVWPGEKATNTAFEGCVRNHGLVATAGAVPPRTLFEVAGLVSSSPQEQSYAIATPEGMTKASVTYTTSAMQALNTLLDRGSYYSLHRIPNREYTVRQTVVVDPYTDDETGSLLTTCVLAS